MPFKVLIVIPTYNEAENIKDLLPAIWQKAPDVHILVVDDNSADGTAEIVRSMQTGAPGKLHLLRRAGKLGLASAYTTAFKWGLARGYDALIEMDADFSHDPATLPEMLKALESKPVVVGSRYIDGGGTENWNFFRKLISRFGSWYARTILGLNVADLTGGFNAWRGEVISKINPDNIQSEGYTFQIELKYRAHLKGFEIIELPIVFRERRAGKSKMSMAIAIEAMIRVWLLRWRLKN